MKDFYYDCAPSTGIVTACYTSHGIRSIDGEYSRRIQNLIHPVQRIIQIDRRHHYERDNYRSDNYRSDYWDDYTEIPLDKDYRVFNHCAFIHNDREPFIIFEETAEMKRLKSLGILYQERELIVPSYSFTNPIYSHIHKGEDPEVLEKDIKTNPHLHKLIKKNLLGNLESYLKLI